MGVNKNFYIGFLLNLISWTFMMWQHDIDGVNKDFYTKSLFEFNLNNKYFLIIIIIINVYI